MNAKNKYRQLCADESSIPIFCQDWWLDTVCGEDNWDVCIVENGGKIVASMPYYYKRRFGFKILQQPPLTQTLGPWLRPIEAKYGKMLGRQKDLFEALIKQLPPFDKFEQKWHHNLTNWLPFYWAGFKQSTRYTYILRDITDMELIWKNLQGNIRSDIKKARVRNNIKISDGYSISDFLKLNRLTFERNNKSLPYSEYFIENLERVTSERSCSKVLIAHDDEGNHHAGAFIVWDGNAAYYLMGGGDPALRNSGATSLCIWKAIEHASMVSNSFDFEGSMLEPVERFFRAFGAEQVPYYSISKINSKLLQSVEVLRTMVNK